MTIARYYDESKNKEGAFFPGVPLRDLTEDEYAALTPRMRDSIDASSFYRKTKPPTETAPLTGTKE
jgi:hypothetical protein